MPNALQSIKFWWLNRMTLAIQPILGKRTPSGIAGPHGKQDSVIRFHNEVDWKTGKLHRAITTQDLTHSYNLFLTEEEARAERDLILASIETNHILLFEEKEVEKGKPECENILLPQEKSGKGSGKSKRKTKKQLDKQSTELPSVETTDCQKKSQTNQSSVANSKKTPGESNLSKKEKNNATT